MDATKTVRATDFDALACRVSAQKRRYLDDPFLIPYIASLEQVIRFEHKTGARRVFNSIVKGNKQPIINRGTFIRSKSIDLIVERFLAKFVSCRVISLGAGSDTRPFRVLKEHKSVEYIELDFQRSTKMKHACIGLSEELSAVCGTEYVAHGSPEWYDKLEDGVNNPMYKLIPIDLTEIDKLKSLLTTLSPEMPTLVISEAMLCYLESNKAHEVIQALRIGLPRGAMAVYDPIGGEGNFGEVMVENLRMRNLSMPSLLEFNTLGKYKHRLIQLGVDNVLISDTYTLFEEWVSQEEKTRISKLEFLDEIEELKLLLEHYCLALGWWGFEWDVQLHFSI